MQISLKTSLVSTIVVLAEAIDSKKSGIQLKLNESISELKEMDILTLKELKLALHEEFTKVSF
jgi:hypothetical protein